MVNSEISLSNLVLLLNQKFGKNGWINFEPETLMLELGNPDLIILEKIHVVQILAKDGVMESLRKPEFVLQACLVANNEPAEFEEIILPNSLQLAWAVKQFQWIATLTGEHVSWPSEFSDFVFYVLNLEGFSKAVDPFLFVGSDRFTPGQTEEDTLKKARGIVTYLTYMRAKSQAEV